MRSISKDSLFLYRKRRLIFTSEYPIEFAKKEAFVASLFQDFLKSEKIRPYIKMHTRVAATLSRVFARTEERDGVLFDLLGRLEILVEERGAVVFARLVRIVAADRRAYRVVFAAEVRVERAARGVNEEVPVPVFDEDRDALVIEIPANVVKFGEGRRLIDRKREILTALRMAEFAKLLRWNLRPLGLSSLRRRSLRSHRQPPILSGFNGVKIAKLKIIEKDL